MAINSFLNPGSVLVLYMPIIKYITLNIFSIISTSRGKTEKGYDRLKLTPNQHCCDGPICLLGNLLVKGSTIVFIAKKLNLASFYVFNISLSH